MYCSPTASDDYKMSLIKYLYSLSSSTDLCIIMGDFNSPDMAWPSLTGCSAHSNALWDLDFDTNLCQLIKCPNSNNGNVLDLVLTSSEGVVKDIDTSYVHTFQTDLFFISFCIDGSYKPNCKNIPKFMISKRRITRVFEKLPSTHATLIVMWRRSGPSLRNPS